MASPVNQQQRFPAVPPSLSAGDHEMRDYYAPQDASRPAMNQTPYLTPYLGLRARLSQIWINRWTILLVLILVRLLFAIAGVNDSLSSARREALSACTQVENIGSTLASGPHFAAQGINEMTAKGVEEAVGALTTMLDMSVNGVENIVLFVIHMMTSTYLCLITLAVSGSLHAAVELGNQVVQHLNGTIDDITNGINGGVKDVTDGINSLIDAINGVPLVPDFTKPSIDLTKQIDELNGLKDFAPDIQEGLNNLNKSIPTFEDVQNFTDNIIRLPFEEVKKLIGNLSTFEFDRELLPVPQKEQLQFCSEGNSLNKFFDGLVEFMVTAKRVGLIVLLILAIIVIVPMAYSEIRRYRRTEDRVSLLAKGHDGMDVVYLASRPHSSTIGLWIGKRFGSTRRQNIVRWAWAYATSPPMLFLLSLGLAGLFSCLCQYIMLRQIQQKAPELTEQVADFAGTVVKALDNASMSWSGGVNGAIGKLDSEINDDILSWVNTTTSAVNNTLNGFVDEMSNTLNKTFGGTVLYDPIKEVLNCLIGLKIAGVQKGLTWVQDNAHVSFPGVPNNTFSLGALAKVSNSSTAAELLADPSGKTKDEITEAVDHIVNKLLDGIRFEASISLALILTWLIIAIAGLIYAMTLYPRQYQSPRAIDPYAVNPEDQSKEHGYPPTVAPPQYEYAPNKPTSTPAPLPFIRNVNDESESEKFGQVDAHAVAESSRPGHGRQSSYGQVAHSVSPIDPSPDNEKNNPFSDPFNPFASPHDRKS
jgi:phage-related protein